MDWTPEGKEFPLSANKKITIDRPKKEEKVDDLVNPILAYCIKFRDKWTYEENPGHVTRWNTVMDHIKSGNRDAAVEYAIKYSKWDAWANLLKMLEDM